MGSCIDGYSLRHWNQLTNTVHLVVITFVSSTTVLCLFSHAMTQAMRGEPLQLSWQMIIAVLGCLLYLCTCGLRGSREHRAVYLTFLTGTPAALCMAVVWFSLFRRDAVRDVVAVSVVVLGYVAYSVEVVLADRSRDGALRLHYFSGVGFVLVLVTLLSALAISV